MSAFEDYCIVCDKICQSNSAYCSDGCKEKDQKQSASFTLSSNPSVQYQHTHSHSHPQSARNSVSHASVSSAIPTIISPLLTPQVFPRSFQNGATPMANVASMKSPQLKDLTYESPLLNSSTSALNDLDSNRLDLNASCIPLKNAKTVPHSNNMMARDASSSISERLSLSSISSNENNLNLNTKLFARDDNQNPMTDVANVSNVSNVLSTCASENYKKWLSIH